MRKRGVLACISLCAALFVGSVSAQDTGAGWQSADTGQADSTYIGSVDSPRSGARIDPTASLPLSGWFVDTSAQGWAGADQVQVFQGPMSGGTLLAQGSIGVNRPDVAAALGNQFWAASGWTAAIDPGKLPLGDLTLSINLHTPAKGWWARTIQVSVASGPGEVLAPAPAAQGPLPRLTVLTPQPGDAVSTSNRQYVIGGSASDPAQSSGGIDGVEVWLNGEANTDNATFLGLADVSANGNWSLTFDPAQFQPADANLYAYARSALSGKRRLVVVHFQITNRR